MTNFCFKDFFLAHRLYCKPFFVGCNSIFDSDSMDSVDCNLCHSGLVSFLLIYQAFSEVQLAVIIWPPFMLYVGWPGPALHLNFAVSIQPHGPKPAQLLELPLQSKWATTQAHAV